MANHITVDDAAKLLNVDARTIRRWCESGKLKAERVGKGAHSVWLIDPASIEGVKRNPRGRQQKK